MFLKNLSAVWAKHLEYNSSNTILIDDARYKSLKNPCENYICPPTFEPEDESQNATYLMNTLLPYINEWMNDPFPTK